MPADESVVDRDSLQSRTAGIRPFAEPDPLVGPPASLAIVDPVPTVDALPPGLTEADVSAGLLSAEVPEVAGGTFVVVPGS